MIFYLSSLTLPVLQELRKRVPHKLPSVLRSYGVQSNEEHLFMNKMRNEMHSLILDSGTFSLHFSDAVTDATLSFEGYLEYLKLFGSKFDFYFNYDRNFTVEGFEENLYYQKQIEKEGLDPVPVIHDYFRGEIDYYSSHNYKLVALGSVMEKGAAKSLRTPFDVKHAVNRLIKHNVKIHLFAAASYSQLAHLPIYSSDASSWAQYAAAGRILFWNEKKEDEDKQDIIRLYDRTDLKPDGSYFFHQYPELDALEAHLDSMGISYIDLMGGRYNLYRQVVNAAFYMQLEDIISKKHREQGFPY